MKYQQQAENVMQAAAAWGGARYTMPAPGPPGEEPPFPPPPPPPAPPIQAPPAGRRTTCWTKPAPPASPPPRSMASGNSVASTSGGVEASMSVGVLAVVPRSDTQATIITELAKRIDALKLKLQSLTEEVGNLQESVELLRDVAMAADIEEC